MNISRFPPHSVRPAGRDAGAAAARARRRSSIAWGLVGCLCLLAGGANGAVTPIGITVREPDGVERRRWPLTVSVPFARGALVASAPLAVRDEAGTALPIQTRPLATWPDGSVRWMLIDTQVDLRPNQERRLRVEAGATEATATPLRVAAGEAQIAIDSGALRFAIPRDRFAIADGLRLAGVEAPVTGPITALLVAGERRGLAQTPTEMRVLESGPLRARVELRGTYGNGFDYVVRVDAYAGQPWLRVLHTFVNRNPAAFTSVPRIAIEVPLGTLKPARYRLGVVGARMRSGDLGDAPLIVVQRDNVTAEVAGERDAAQLTGWIELANSRASVGAAGRWFWQQYPQSFTAGRDRLTYNLWAPEADAAGAGVGAAKTHEVVLWASGPQGLAPGTGTALTRPLVGVVDPLSVVRSGALPDAVASGAATARFVRKAADAAQRYLTRNEQEPWNDCGKATCTAADEARRRVGAYGMWNWGDWNFRGYEDRVKGTDSWGNLEYDTTQVLALAYTASGTPALFDAMVAAARHYMDVDTIHAYPARPEWVGMNHPKNPLHFSFQLGGPDLGHTWTRGLISYYYLTGDERGLAAARGIADYLTTRIGGAVRGNPRQWGWPQVALLAVHEATGEARYLEAARQYAARGMAAHPPSGARQWKLGILADALAYTHAATGDPAMRAWLETYAAGVMAHRAQADARAFPAVAYVGRLRGDATLREAALGRAEQLDLGAWGKPFTVNGRIGFRIYSLLAE